jgi:23S rRNA pseudouridine2605 synthase
VSRPGHDQSGHDHQVDLDRLFGWIPDDDRAGTGEDHDPDDPADDFDAGLPRVELPRTPTRTMPSSREKPRAPRAGGANQADRAERAGQANRADQADATAEADERGERLQKVLARAGVASRRACEDLISAGRVTINGRRAVLGDRIEAGVDEVRVNGVPIGTAPDTVYYLLNKPTGVVTTASDPQGRPTVVELVPDDPRVFPVGRLDVDTEGLLLLTNDGALANVLTHPSHGIEKEYVAQVTGTLSPGALRRLREGVMLEDGMTAPARVSQPSPGLVRLTIHEGRNRQVRRMLGEVGHPVRRLVRVRIGPLSDDSLPPGRWRGLSGQEVTALRRATGDTTQSAQRPVRKSSQNRRPSPR